MEQEKLSEDSPPPPESKHRKRGFGYRYRYMAPSYIDLDDDSSTAAGYLVISDALLENSSAHGLPTFYRARGLCGCFPHTNVQLRTTRSAKISDTRHSFFAHNTKLALTYNNSNSSCSTNQAYSSFIISVYIPMGSFHEIKITGEQFSRSAYNFIIFRC